MILNKSDLVTKRESYSQGGNLTSEMLKTFEGCENYSDEEAQQITDGLQSLASLLFEFYKETNTIKNNILI
ncbi:MAG: hypothetical protein ACKVQB_08180 [Bacteroidia bacterium]